MALIPPGIQYLTSLLPFLLTPPTITSAVLVILKWSSGLVLPQWLSLLCALTSHLVFAILKRKFRSYRHRKEAAARNAFILPSIKTKGLDFAGFGIVDALQQDFTSGYPMELQRIWEEEYGPSFQLTTPLGQGFIFTSEPDHMKAILSTQFDNFHKGPFSDAVLSSFFGSGIFNADGDLWKFHRTMTRPYFTKDRISHFDIFDIQTDNALKQVTTRLDEGYPFDFQELAGRFSMDSTSQFLFGHDPQSISAGLSYPVSASHLNLSLRHHPSNIFGNAFTEGQNKTARRINLGPFWPLVEFWKDEVKPYRQIVDRYFQQAIDDAFKRRDTPKVSQKVDMDQHTLLDDLIQHTQDRQILKDELVNLLGAGRDPTGTTLTYSLYMLVQHPEAAQRLRQEVLSTVGPSDRPTYAHIRDMKYLRAFINEVLRLYPPVVANARMSRKAAVWTSRTAGSKPYFIPPNMQVILSVLTMHRRQDLWGPDAEEFDPDRFLDERLHRYLIPNAYIFLPFNAGPRICLGQQFTYQLISFFLIRLMQQFTNFRLAPDAQPEDSKPPARWANGTGRMTTEKITPYRHVILHIKGGLWVRMDAVKAE